MSRLLKVISGTQLVLCVDKRFVFIAPDKMYILKLNIRKHELLWTDFVMSFWSENLSSASKTGFGPMNQHFLEPWHSLISDKKKKKSKLT